MQQEAVRTPQFSSSLVLQAQRAWDLPVKVLTTDNSLLTFVPEPNKGHYLYSLHICVHPT